MVAEFAIPKRGVEYVFYVSLVSQADTKLLKANPTLASGDVKISKDGGTEANLNTLPTITPASGKHVKVTVSATEMTADNISIVFSDAAGAEWCDLEINIQTATRALEDLAWPETAGRSIRVESDGMVHADLKEWLGSAPSALQSGRVDSYVGAMADGVMAAAKFAAGAFDAVWSVTTRILTAGTNIVLAKGTGITGLNDLSAAQVNTEADAALADAGVTTTRTAFLDKLNVSGNVASSAEVTSIQNNTRVVRAVPSIIERPDSGTFVLRIELLCYDDVGNMEAPDSAPTISVVNQAGTSRNANLDSGTMTLVSTGRYRSTYTVDTIHDLEELLFEFAVVEGGNTRTYVNVAQVVDTTAIDFTAADRTDLQTVLARADVAISTRATPAQVGTEAAAALAAVGVTSTVTGRIDAAITSRMATFSYTSPLDAAGVRTAIGLSLANLDEQLGDIPTVAEFEARSITSASYATAANVAAVPDAVWDEALSGHATGGSAGAILSELLDGIPAAVLDAPDGLETGVTVRQGFKAMAAAIAGVYVPGLTTVFKAVGNPSTTRISAATPADGGRTSVTLSL